MFVKFIASQTTQIWQHKKVFQIGKIRNRRKVRGETMRHMSKTWSSRSLRKEKINYARKDSFTRRHIASRPFSSFGGAENRPAILALEWRHRKYICWLSVLISSTEKWPSSKTNNLKSDVVSFLFFFKDFSLSHSLSLSLSLLIIYI